MCGNSIIGGVLRQVTSNKVANYYDLKTKITVKVHSKIKRGKAYAGEDTFVGHRKRKEFLDSYSGSYIYNNNSKLNLKAKKIFDSNRDSLAKWLYDNARQDMSWIIKSYKDFKKAVLLDDNEIIEALFYSKNYITMGHRDDDRSESMCKIHMHKVHMCTSKNFCAHMTSQKCAHFAHKKFYFCTFCAR